MIALPRHTGKPGIEVGVDRQTLNSDCFIMLEFDQIVAAAGPFLVVSVNTKNGARILNTEYDLGIRSKSLTRLNLIGRKA